MSRTCVTCGQPLTANDAATAETRLREQRRARTRQLLHDIGPFALVAIALLVAFATTWIH